MIGIETDLEETMSKCPKCGHQYVLRIPPGCVGIRFEGIHGCVSENGVFIHKQNINAEIEA